MKRHPRRRKQTRDDDVLPELPDQDETFYFIAGCTEGGFPFGTTWEEHEAELEMNRKQHNIISIEESGPIPVIEMQLSEQQMKVMIDTYDFHIEEMEHFLNVQTGEVIMLSTNRYERTEEEEELYEMIEEDFGDIYYRIPRSYSSDGYALMCEFTMMVENEKLRTKLEHALDGRKKVFRKFKDVLAEDETELERYYAHVDANNRRQVLKWLESIGVRAIIDA